MADAPILQSLEDPADLRALPADKLPALAAAGQSASRLAALAGQFAGRRLDEEREVARLLAESCRLDPSGYADLDPAPLRRVPDHAGRAALARLILAIGGGGYAPPPEKTARVLDWLRGGEGRQSMTLGRCRFSRRVDGVSVCRESRGLPEFVSVRPGTRLVWDRRFEMTFATGAPGDPLWRDLRLGALGRDGWAEVVGEEPELRKARIPYAARLVLPAVRDSEGVIEVPHLDFRRHESASREAIVKAADFAPRNTLSGSGFCLARPVSSTISSGVVETA